MSGGLDDFLALYLCTALHQMLDFCTDLHADEQMHPLDYIPLSHFWISAARGVLVRVSLLELW